MTLDHGLSGRNAAGSTEEVHGVTAGNRDQIGSNPAVGRRGYVLRYLCRVIQSEANQRERDKVRQVVHGQVLSCSGAVYEAVAGIHAITATETAGVHGT